ncbi:MAG: hypothetical protein ACJAVK_001301 [Akkermansiaceae bacterium]|jgi:hypothetical protein
MDLPEQIPLEILEQRIAQFKQMEADAEPPDRSIGALRESHEELCGEMKEFELGPTLRLIASLETFPELHANTIRIEVLLHLAVCSCEGSKQPELADLKSWTALLNTSPMSHQEDPTEDAFVGYICTPGGGFRVYPGIFSNADFILERLLLFLEEKTDFPGFRETYESALELLKVSEAVADELGHRRYSGSDSSPAGTIQLPAEDQIAKHSEAIRFGENRLSNLGIDLEKLLTYLFKIEETDDFESKPIFGSPLERCPLIPSENGFLVASLSCLCRAAVSHILEMVPTMGGWSDTFFEKENYEFFINYVIKRLGVENIGKIKLPPFPDSIPPVYRCSGQFDYGMAVISLVLNSPVSQGRDLEEVETFTDQQVDDFTKFVGDCCLACESIEGFRGGLVLLAIAGVGRPVMIGLKDLRPNWHFFSSGLADWQTLSTDQDFSAKRLWYLGLQQQFAKDAKVQFINTAGLLNLYAYWKQQDFTLLSNEIDPRGGHNMVWIGEGHAQSLNIELKETIDRHCSPSPNGNGWILLQRGGPDLNPDQGTNLRYLDYSAANKRRLSGCIEHQDAAWWLEASDMPENSDSSNLLYRIWDCVLNWLERVLPVLSSEHPDWRPNNIQIVLEFPNVDEWDLQSATMPGESSGELVWEAMQGKVEIKLTFPEEFLKKFYRPDNFAEREIVAKILRSVAKSAGVDPSDSDIEECVTRIIKAEGTRFFHVLKSPTLESALGGPESAEPTLIPYEEIGRVNLGLVYEVSPSPPVRITDAKKAQALLDKIVAHIQARVSARLSELRILPVVSTSFLQIDELSRDKSRWTISTRSLLSLEDNAEWLHDRIRSENSRITTAEIANRALIETAVYSHNPKATEIVSQTEHASLLAEFAVMIDLASHRDAIAAGFVPANITIHPNGTLEYSDSFQQDVFQPYLKSRMDDHIQWDAEAYDGYFDSPKPQEDPPQELPPEAIAFKRAFRAEFGFSYDALDTVVAHFDQLAISQQRSGGSLDARVLRRMLKGEAGLNDAQVTSFLKRFVLPIRPSWNSKLPPGCDVNDVLPWRYFRGLSVLVRPFVEISRSPRMLVISAPHLHRWHRYLTNSILEGHLPEKLFQSSEMRSYLGSIAFKKGHQFTEQVSEELKLILPDLKVEVYMTALGAPAMPDLGDIDVLAWDEKTGIVLLIECKRLKTALTVRQVTQQLEDFRGNMNDKEDALAKHQRRVDWLKKNAGELSQITGIPSARIQWTPLLVTSGRVPMSFVDAIDFPKEQVVPMRDLESHVSNLLAPTSSPNLPD